MMKKRIVALFTALGLCMGMTTTAFAADETGAELLKKADCYITFEDTVEDLNGNYTPTYNGTANYVEGKFGKAANAAGKVSHIAIENMTFGEDSFTIATWMKINNYTSDPSLFGNKDWGSGSNPGFLMIPTGTGLKMNANVPNGSRTDLGFPYRLYAVENENGLGEWMYVAYVVDRTAGTVALSINGGKLLTQSMVYEEGVLDDTTNNYPFRIGEDGKGEYNNEDFNVDYDEFAIFKEALTLEQIQSLYTYAPEGYEPAVIQEVEDDDDSAPVKSLEESLIAHYDGINNAEGGHDAEATVWKDLSGKGNDFVLDETYGWTDKALQVQSKVAGYFPQAVVDATNSNEFTLELSMGAFESLAEEYNTLIVSGNDEFSLFHRVGSDVLEFKYNDPNGRLKFGEATDGITDSTLTYVVNSNKCYAKVYVDGVLANEVVITELGNDADNLFLGHYSSERFWNGDVYSIRVYDRALTEDEVKQNVAEIDAKYRTVATPEPTEEPTEEPTPTPTEKPAEEKDNNNTLVIVIAVIAVVAIVAGVVYAKSKKKNK